MANWYVSVHGAKGSNNILVFSPSGEQCTSALDYTGMPPDIKIYDLRGFVWGPNGQTLYVGNSDKPNSQILRFALNGSQYLYDPDFLITGNQNDGTALCHPYQLAFGPDGNLYVSNQNTNLVSRYYGPNSTVGTPGDPMPSLLPDFPDGTFVSLSATFTVGDGSIRGIQFGPDGNLYVADRDGDAIRIFDSSGNKVGNDITSTGDVEIKRPIQVLFRGDDVLYIGSSKNNAIVTYDTSGTLAYLVGPKAENLKAPSGLAFDGTTLFLASRETNTILRYDPEAQPPLQEAFSVPGDPEAAFNPEFLSLCCPSTTKGSAEALTLVYRTPPWTIAEESREIYVGTAASVTTADLSQYGITGVLNVAYDSDDSVSDDLRGLLSEDPYRPRDPAGAAITAVLPYQLAKVGLIDGYGNEDMLLLSAVYMADQLMTFPPATPVPPLVNFYTPGNLLIHCFSGGSRSVTVTALYIYYKFGVFYGLASESDFNSVYQNVVNTRGPHAVNVHPTEGMCRTARSLVKRFSAVFPYPVYEKKQ